MKAALYPGTFDPITNGHLDIIERALSIVDRLVVLVVCNPPKSSLFSVEQRMDMVKQTVAHWNRISVESFDGLLVDEARKRNIHTVIRGLRALTDFEYEFQMALTNRSLDPNFESVFLMTNNEYSYLSSTLAKDIARLGGDVSKFVPSYVEKKLTEAYGRNQK